MKINNSRGFSAVEALLIVVLLGLLGGVGYYVYSQNKTEEATEPTANTQQRAEDKDVAGVKTYEGIKFSIPANWKNVQQNTEPYGDAPGSYLLSPDYKEKGGGQLAIASGAYINFGNFQWVGIDATTTVEQAASKVKNGEGGYLDADSVKVTKVAGNNIVIYNSGHTTDGVTAIIKTSKNKWLEANFGTLTGDDGEYNAKESPLYPTFTKWLEDFIKLNN